MEFFSLVCSTKILALYRQIKKKKKTQKKNISCCWSIVPAWEEYKLKVCFYLNIVFGNLFLRKFLQAPIKTLKCYKGFIFI